MALVEESQTGLVLRLCHSQVLLDLLFNANRVFELDDLWTNTLGAYLAYIGFQYFRARLLAKNGEM